MKTMRLRAGALAAMLCLALLCGCKGGGGAPESTEPGQTLQTQDTREAGTEGSTEPVQTLPPMEFPVRLEDGRLEVTGLFLFTGMNPDRGRAPGENIPVLVVKNCSGEYLTRGELTLTSVEGETFTFRLEQVPDGQTVWAFATDGGSLDSEGDGAAVTGSADFEPQPELPEGLACSGERTTLTLQNQGDSVLKGLRVWCHCLVEGAYFGGAAYVYPVEQIAPGSSVTVEAAECYLGEASVVRVAADG